MTVTPASARQRSTIESSDEAASEFAHLVGADRVLAVLKKLSSYPHGVSLEELTNVIGSSKPTVHRAMGALRRAGLADQDGRGWYRLGDEFLRMAFIHYEARPDHVRIAPALEAVAERFVETVHYAVLDGREVVYRAKVDPPSGPVRLTSTVGGRNPAYATAVGKLLLAYRLDSLNSVKKWVHGAPLTPLTPNTVRTAKDLYSQLIAARENGYSIDDQENEPGVNCLALPVYTSSLAVPSGAVSISALAYRTPLASLIADVDAFRALLGPLAISAH